MPAMNDLLGSLQDNTPTTETELRSLLKETGYDLVMREPGAEPEHEDDMGPVDEDVPADDEEVEVEEVSEDALPADIKEMIQAMIGGKPPPSKHDLSHSGRNKMRVKVARIVLGNENKGDKYE